VIYSEEPPFCDFSKMLLSMIFSLQGNHLSQQKMYTLRDIVMSQLFLNPECRAILLPDILLQVREVLDYSGEVSSTTNCADYL
jgi:dedicator of cytokinesis protein 1